MLTNFSIANLSSTQSSNNVKPVLGTYSASIANRDIYRIYSRVYDMSLCHTNLKLLWKFVETKQTVTGRSNCRILSPSSIISTYGNIRRYPIAPFPLFVCACSALITWCFVYKVTNLSSSINFSKMDILLGKKINQYHTHIDFVILYQSPKYPLLNPLI